MIRKKGAMFGLEGRVLRKYAGSIFLASLRRLTFRLVEAQQASRVLTAKGAMFGLDARIALVIFGALSVISGAALYSAIKQSRVVSLVYELDEIGKAYSQYVLDTGADMPLEPLAWTGYTATRPLVENNGVVGWDGPYLSYELNPTVNINNKSRYALVHPRYTDILIGNFSNSSWGESIINDCSAPGVCYVWSAFTNVDAETAAAVDLYIDGVADKSNGRIRIHDGDPNFIHVFYKLQPLIKQN